MNNILKIVSNPKHELYPLFKWFTDQNPQGDTEQFIEFARKVITIKARRGMTYASQLMITELEWLLSNSVR